MIALNKLENDILAICNRADEMLWSAYGQSTSAPCGHFVFPSPRDSHKVKRRVSEQEARLAYIETLIENERKYAIEAPTAKRYAFKQDATERAAMTDLCVYARGQEQECNVEFKSGGASNNRTSNNNEHIRKDVEKLLREEPWGVWYHLLRECNSATVASLVAVLNKKIDEVAAERQDLAARGMSVHICVLESGVSLHWSAKHDSGRAVAKLPEFDKASGGVWKTSARSVGWTVREI